MPNQCTARTDARRRQVARPFLRCAPAEETAVIRTRTLAFACVALALALLAGPTSALTRQATPVASTEGLSLAASGLENPRGFDWGPDGALYVAEASITPAGGTGATPASAPPATAGLDGDIVKIVAGACPTVFQGNLPSSGGEGGPDLGPAAIEILNGQVYLLDEGGGAAHGNPLTPDGIYLIPGDGSAKVVADLGTWVAANPVSNPPNDGDAGGDLTDMVSAGNGFLVLESDAGQVIQVDGDGSITRLVDLSIFETRPAGLLMTSDGRVLVGLGDRVVLIGAEGVVSDTWTGLTDIVDIAAGPNDTLYALQADGTVVRQVAPDASKTVATGFHNPAAIAFGPDAGLYVSSPASGGVPGIGSVVRISTDIGQVPAMSHELLSGSACVPTPTPAATGTSAPATGTPDGGATSAPDGDTTATAETGSTVTIDNYAFSPASITVSVGTTVTWVNNDTTAHTVTADDGSFDSGNLAPGESFTYTFTSAGSFVYHCNYHPNMEGTVAVN
jgi:plastocyanin